MKIILYLIVQEKGNQAMSVTEMDSTRKNQKALYKNIKNVCPRKTEAGNTVIGITMLTNNRRNQLFAVKAMYKDEINEPYIVKIVSYYDQNSENYDIDVRNINPKDSTLQEIFALCSYCDDKKISNGSAFGSFRELKNFTNKAISLKTFKEKKFNWEKQITEIKEDFLKEGLFYQYQSCLQLLDIFDYSRILSLEEREEDTSKSDITIQKWKKESTEYKDVRDAVTMLMKKEFLN